MPTAPHALREPAAPAPSAEASAPVAAAPRPGRIAAALLAAATGIGTLAALAFAFVEPSYAPVIAPAVVVVGALALWGAARVDLMRLRGDLDRLAAENERLATRLETASDAAWEIRESEERYRSLVEAREKAEAASGAKSRILATVSHEFRTPLNGILGLANLLLETRLSPDQATYAEGVRSSGEALLALVDDLLDFSRIEAGRLDLRPEATDIGALLEEIAELLAARAYQRGVDIGVRLDPALPAEVTVDAARLRQVLLNLAGNGIKFTERGGVTLSAAMAGRDGATARIEVSVADTGPGIAPEDAERIFGEFEQADAAITRRHGGAGLGLAIGRRIVRRMGGELTLRSAPGEGSRFAFALDLPVSAPPRPTHAEGVATKRILVVMPEGAEPAAVAGALRDAGAEARIAGSVNEAAALAGAAAAAALPYDAILLDRRAAADAGAALLRLREAAGRPVAAAILIEPSGRGEIAALRESGFAAYLVRPTRRSSLLRIAAALAGAEAGFHTDPGDARPASRRAPKRAAASLDILLAEDNEISALLARAVLEGLGHAVTEVRDGAAAVAAATAAPGRHAAILLDLHMPGLDGLAAARAIRAAEREAGAPPAAIIALTADVLPETRAAAEAAGFDAVLEKPVAPETLRTALLRLTAAAKTR